MVLRSPGAAHKYTGGAAGPRERGAPRDREPHSGAAGLPGLHEVTIIHPHRSPGERSRGNPHPKALLPVGVGTKVVGAGYCGILTVRP